MATKPRSTRRLGKPKPSRKAKQPAAGKQARKPKAEAAPKRAVRKPSSRKPLPRKSLPRKPQGPARGVVETALAAFAHEVRTPLTGILAISSLLETSDLGAREQRWVETIRASAEHLAALATLYVDAAKSMAAHLPMREDFFDLRALARSAGDGLAGRATANGLQSQVTIAESLPQFATGDAVRLRAALENLIDNAVKFTPSGLVELDVSAVPHGRSGMDAVFAVSDSGIGLSLADVKRLFRPFSQASLEVASRFGGAGLGLWSVKQLAQAMGGNIGVAQRKDGGAVFTLTVRVGLPPQEQRTPSAPLSPEAQGLKVLSVEDNPFGRVVLNTVLGELGHKIEFVGQGELAAERVSRGDLDVVLMDMVLPGIDGVETIRRLRALGALGEQIGIIGVSGREQDEAKARAAGADAFLTKPVSPRALAAALGQATVRRVSSGG